MKKKVSKKTGNKTAVAARISSKTDALQQAKKELKIEASLEKVRVKALKMKKPEDLLNICQVVYKELRKLGFDELRNAIIHTFNDEQKFFYDYNYSDLTPGAITRIPYSGNPVVEKFIKNIRKSKSAFSEIKVAGKQLTGWKKFRKANKEANDPRLNNIKALYYYIYSVGAGSIGISTYKPIAEEQQLILRRLRNVFDLAYRRYLDIEKAEMQAREAEIELALERVRTKAMAMQRSDELADLVAVVFKELTRLGFPLTSSIIWIHDHVRITNTLWIASAEMYTPPRSYNITAFHSGFFRSVVQAWKARDVNWSYALKGKEKKDFEKAFFKELPKLPPAFKKALIQPEQVVFSASFNNFGALETVATEPLSNEKQDILHRFGRVFDLSYTRFHDLLKAEAQAREARIEAALERVRAKAMAMHNSIDLSQTASTVFTELKGLGIRPIRSGIGILSKKSRKAVVYGATGKGGSDSFTLIGEIDLTGHPSFEKQYQHWLKNKNYFTVLGKKELHAYYKVLYAKLTGPYIPKKHKDKEYGYYFSFTDGLFYVWSETSFSDDEIRILNRFKVIFDLTFRRYFELTKAEAQTREAQIQLVLERVRARTMAMHHSDEITDIVKLIYQELDKLKVNNESTDIEIGLIDEETGFASIWAHFYLSDGTISTFQMPMDHFSMIRDEYRKWRKTLPEKRKEIFITSEFSRKQFRQFLKETADFPELDEIFRPLKEAPIKKWVTHNAYFSHGLLTLQGTDHYSQETQEIQKRLAKVFEQTYIRFLDLKKAEAQAREAQIEASLERIRSRTMGMQKTDELKEIVALLYEECNKFGFESVLIILNTRRDEDDGFNWWFSANEQTVLPQSYFIPDLDEPVLRDIKSIWESGKPDGYIQMGGNIKAEHDRRLFSETGLRELPNHLKEMMLSYESVFLSIANMKNGFIEVAANAFISEYQMNILRRYTRVFEQTYSRFLDLQKAEAQAREAQIEAAMEKIRSRSLAMHQSTEMKEVITVFFEKLNELNVLLGTIGIQLFDPATMNSFVWVGNAIQDPQMVNLPYDEQLMHDDNLFNDMWQSRNEGTDIINKLYSREQKDKFFDHIFRNNDFTQVPEPARAVLRQLPNHIACLIVEKNSALLADSFTGEFFSDEQIKILKRAAKVFEQAYIRFLDLQKAEAQAREARIEAALEKVRSRSLAMHTTEELGEVASVVFEKLRELDMPVDDGVAIVTHIEGSKDQVEWMENPGMPSAMKFFQPYYEHPILDDYWKAKKEGLDFIAPKYTAEQSRSFFNHIFENTDYKYTPQEIRDYCLAAETYSYFAAFQKNSSIFINDYSGRILTDQEIDIVKRFSKVFEQAYVRFLDLQKAEAQAREAQIEAALERVRASALAMHNSEDLVKVAGVLREQMSLLGQYQLESAVIELYDLHEDYIESWHTFVPAAEKDGKKLSGKELFRKDACAFLEELIRMYKSPDKDYTIVSKGKKQKDFVKVLSEQIPEVARVKMPELMYYTCSDFTGGTLLIGTLEEPSKESKELLSRASKVFDLAYRRFLDLKQAEAQAREAEIQLAMERVRARSLAMHKSEELGQVIGVMYRQLEDLGINNWGCELILCDEQRDILQYWSSTSIKSDLPEPFNIPRTIHPFFDKQWQAWKNGKDHLVLVIEGKEKKEYDDLLLEQSEFQKYPEEVRELIRSRKKDVFTHACLKYGLLESVGDEPLSDTDFQILQRFAKVFEQSYTRFLDLQKAEAQAREAQIEAALERIRSVSMAMRKSNELLDVIHTVFGEWKKLGLELYECNINLLDREKKEWTNWGTGIGEAALPRSFLFPLFDDPFVHQLFDDTISAVSNRTYLMEGEPYRRFLEGMIKYTDFKNAPKEYLDALNNVDRIFLTHAFMQYGSMDIVSAEEPPEPTIEILKRFAKVFEQAYTRYLDVVQAEAQAREAQIEAALERVRSKAMAMHKSDDLKFAVATVFEELDKLNLGLLRCGIAILDKEKPRSDIWITIKSEKGSTIQVSGDEPLDIHPLLQGAYDAWLKQEDFYYVLQDDDLLSYYQAMNKTNFQQPISASFTLDKKDQQQYFFNAVFHDGSLFAFLDTVFTDEAKAVMKRFANVFNLTYKRFLDLQKAEAQAREARIEMALERIRARALAMHSSAELVDVAKVMREQMALLGQPELESTIVHLYEEDPDHIHSWRAFRLTTDTKSEITHGHMSIPKNSNEFVQEWLDMFYSNLNEYTIELSGSKQDEWYKILGNLAPDVVMAMEKDHSIHEKRFYHFSKFSGGALLMISKKQPAEESRYLLRKAAVVFDLAYRRFGDLQKAEAQAREAQIETALERVRSRSIGMQKSEELKEVIQVVYEQFIHLNIQIDHAGFVVDYKPKENWNFWIADQHAVVSEITVPWYENVWGNQFDEAKEKGENFFATHLSFEEKNKFYSDLLELTPGIPDEAKVFYLTCPGLAISTALMDSVALYIENFKGTSYSNEENAILLRFGKVFQQTYTRFLDLQKAEELAREAQIELSLERIRSQAMAMQKSADLLDIVVTMRAEFVKLGYDAHYFWHMRWLPDKYDKAMTSGDGSRIGTIMELPRHMHGDIPLLADWEKNDEPTVVYVMDTEEAIAYVDKMIRLGDFIQVDPNAPTQDDIRHIGGLTFIMSKTMHGEIGYSLPGMIPNLPAENINTLKRFAGVFDLAYRRFEDLQKAEHRNRETQIELALEKVRAKTMAMQKSDELPEAANLLFQQVQSLGMPAWSAGYCIWDEDKKAITLWMSSEGVIQPALRMPLTEDPSLIHFLDAWERGESFFVEEVGGEALKEHYTYLRTLPGVKETLDKIEKAGFPVPTFQIFHLVYFSKGFLLFITYEPVPEAHEIFKRFGKVFDQTYTRFLDLQKAEAQAREATIEAALEKVSGKAMAMHNSNDLSVTASMVFSELRKLGIKPIRCGVGLLNKESRKGQLYSAASSAGGDSLSLVGWVELSGHPVLENIYDTWLRNEEYYPELIGEQLKSYYELLLSGLPVPVPQDTGQKQYGTFLPFSVGCLYAWSASPYSDAEIKILKRFAKIIDLTFRRYFELQRSEANAKEAVKQAALDRIRADIASMRTISDLNRITPLIWNELTILGVPFIRCGVFIMDESQQLIHTFLSTPDGKAIAAFHLPYNTPGNIGKVLSHWKDNHNYIDYWDEITFTEFADTLVKQGALISSEQYLKTIPKGGFYLHFLPFLQGMLYVGNTTQLSDDEIKIIQSVADAFSTAYARYEDFNKLEAAKKQVDSTLNELQAAQKQLIQTEKMASLGELTAGIAHEIQNPLNFVNNFSDVSNELIDEMKEELAKGNVQLAIEIARDVKQNLEKINHHGKRADGIVKGMLQHSRSSSGHKEPTDINILCDEYLRLAYHGLRAKDKSFNAKFETDFDNNIEKINIVPQEIGRVVLNLINNAFYAVSERAKSYQPSEGGVLYEPTVIVSTKSIIPPSGGKRGAEIRVKDNGYGIPDAIKEKIFQPFFTTKPTGQGTGLGLSLSYDIVKAHGGELKVETKEGEGSEFIIQLPA